MVLVNVRVRPKSAYHRPGLILTASVDSSVRLESLLTEHLNLTSRGGATSAGGTVALFGHGGRPLPLNSSLATHNVGDNDVLESCRSPTISAALSAVLKDLDLLSKLDEAERDEEEEEEGGGGGRVVDLSVLLDGPAPDPKPSWSDEDIKRRKICLAVIKKVIQRDDRYARYDLPPCHDLEDLHRHLQPVWREEAASSSSRRSGGAASSGKLPWNSLGYAFQPSARSRGGNPTVCWELLRRKLEKQLRIAAEVSDATVAGAPDGFAGEDAIEAFVRKEDQRHKRLMASLLNRGESEALPSSDLAEAASPAAAAIDLTRSALAVNPGTTPRRQLSPARRRTRPSSSSATSSSAAFTPCPCGEVRSDSVCLEEGCPFLRKACCRTCFNADHPPRTRNHERIPLDDNRARDVIRLRRRRAYCPVFASGPFAVLCALASAAEGGGDGGDSDRGRRRDLSLTDARLKELAQPRCRSDLYDRHRIRGRNAFACMEGLAERGLVRKEMVVGGTDDGDGGARWSLLPAGEALARRCLDFQRAAESTILHHPRGERRPSPNASRGGQSASGATIIADSREDASYASRLAARCAAVGVDCDKRDLPAGDYIFVVKETRVGSQREEIVLPLVVERKTWSDLADSVTGRGRRRLDCVHLEKTGGDSSSARQCDGGNCQLCRMKRSGCKNVMFMIEGPRCNGQCNDTKRCVSCRVLTERHGPAITQERLEQVLNLLRAKGCHVHFTRNYNETIDSLLIARDLLPMSRFCESTVASVEGNEYSGDDDIAIAISRSIGETATYDSPVSSRSSPSIRRRLTYDRFCSNSRNTTREVPGPTPRGVMKEWTASFFTRHIADGTLGSIVKNDFKLSGAKSSSNVARKRKRQTNATLHSTSRHSKSMCDDVMVLGSGEDALRDSGNDEEAKPSQGSVVLLGVDCVGSTGDTKRTGDGENEGSSSDSTVDLLDACEGGREDEYDVINVAESQDSVEVLGDDGWASTNKSSPSKRSSSSGHINKKRRVGSSEMTEIIDITSQSMPQRCGDSEEDTCDEIRCLKTMPLLLIADLYEYEKHCGDKINCVWQSAYSALTALSEDGEAENREGIRSFLVSMEEKLRLLQQQHSSNGNPPFMDRQVFLRWTLRFQLCMGISLHVLSAASCSNSLKSSWMSKRSSSCVSSRADEEISIIDSQIQSNKKECPICFETLRNEEAESLLCGHTFHANCLQRYARRKCPVCNFDSSAGGAKETEATLREKSTNRAGIERVFPQGPASTAVAIPRTPQDEHAREARLQRFAESRQPSPKKRSCDHVKHRGEGRAVLGGRVVSDDTNLEWKCEKCTLLNDASLPTCDVCRSPNPSLVKPLSSGIPAGSSRPPETAGHNGGKAPRSLNQDVNAEQNSTWTCDTCSLRNDVDDSSCNACGSSNPFAVHDEVAGGTLVNPRGTVATAKKSKARCGACSMEGHNRGTATAANCPQYHTPLETQKRADRKEKAALKAKEQRARVGALKRRVEDGEEERRDRVQQLDRLIEDIRRDTQDQDEYAKKELKRQEKAAKSAERRANNLR